MGGEVAEDGGVADGEGDHLLVRVRLDHHRLQDVPDRVERVPRQVGGRQRPPSLLVVPHLVVLGSFWELGSFGNLGALGELELGLGFGTCCLIVVGLVEVKVDRSDVEMRMASPRIRGSLS